MWGGNDPAISFSNYGLIKGKVGVGKMTSPFTNGGTIASTVGVAGTAVSTYAPITLLPGATFIGHVYEFTDRFGNHGLLNLAGSGATGTLSGVGDVFQNVGTLDVMKGASWLLKGPNGISKFASVEGTLNVTGSLGEPSAMQVSGTLITSGTIASSSGPAVTLAAGSAIELLPGAAFTGAVQGAGSATLDLGAGNTSGSIADFGTAFTGFSEIDVAGKWGLTGTSNPASGLMIGGGGTLQVQGTLAVPGTLLLHGAVLAVSPAGTVEVGSAGGATAGRITVDHFSLLAGYGTLKAPVSDSGTVEATGGTLSLAANVSGKGTIAIDTGSVLNAAGLLGKAAVVFVNGGSNESLIAANPHAIGGLISGFAASDTIDLSGFAETGWSFKGSTLTLNGAGGTVALHFAAGITAADFNIGSDGVHGTAILHT